MKNILLVEDNPQDRELLNAKLADRFDISEAHTLGEAKKALQLRVFDVVLLDIGLPDASRDTVVQEVKFLCRNAALIVLSAYDDLKFMKEAVRQSASSYLIKGIHDNDSESLATQIRVGIACNSACQLLDRGINSLKPL